MRKLLGVILLSIPMSLLFLATAWNTSFLAATALWLGSAIFAAMIVKGITLLVD